MNLCYDVWLHTAMGAATDTDALLAEFGTAKAVFDAKEIELRLLGTLTAAQLDRLSKRDLAPAERTAERCEKEGWRIITRSDADYPKRLNKIKNAPYLLFADGDISCLNSRVPSVAVVGSRKPSHYGEKIAFGLSSSLAGAGVTVVSGGALGIDSAAHGGAVAAGGKTAAVLGCGFGVNYLMQNEPMRREIARNGVLVTEYAPDVCADRGSFPKRNRIISGLCMGVVVVEAGDGSGSLNTAGWAAGQGRAVFAVPGDLIGSAFSGANNLISKGAKPVFTAADILEEFVFEYPDIMKPHTFVLPETQEEKQEQKSTKTELPESLSDTARSVYNCFGEESIHIDELVALSGFSAAQVAQALTELELEGIVEAESSRKYKVL